MTSKFLVRLVAALANAALAWALYVAFLAPETVYPPFGMSEVAFIGTALVVSLITYLAAREDSPFSFTWAFFGVLPTFALVIVAAFAVLKTLPASLPTTLTLGDQTVFIGVVAVLALFNLGIYFAHVGRDVIGGPRVETASAIPAPRSGVAASVHAAETAGMDADAEAVVRASIIPPPGGFPAGHKPRIVPTETGIPQFVTERRRGVVYTDYIQDEFGNWVPEIFTEREIRRFARNRRTPALSAPATSEAHRAAEDRRGGEEVVDVDSGDRGDGRTGGEGDEPVAAEEEVGEHDNFLLPPRTSPPDEGGERKLDS